MRLFVDSADIDEIRACFAWGVVDGVTTTPTFFERLGIHDANDAIREIARDIEGEVHVEALGDSVAQTIDAARRNFELGPNIVSKIPISARGIEAAHRLEEDGIRVNLHLVFSVSQAVMAAKAGVSYVCPLLGRLVDVGLNGSQVVDDIVAAIGEGPGLSSTVMVSSIRNEEQLQSALVSGATAITVPARLLQRVVDGSDARCLHLIADT